ncbi:MAG: serine hydrolase family protein [Parcubacteria group bacterium]|nr:serine hydrolase family protein [Parcubacteria group bacterium]
MKRVFIVHGWEGSPRDCWFPWLKDELEKRGFVVQVPMMPHPETPTIEDWVGYLSAVVGESDRDTYFVGHSIGCQTILRYVQNLEKPIGGIVCVAGFFRLLHLVTDEEREIAKPWLETPMDYENIKKQAGNIIAIFSDNDPDVDLGDKELFEKRLSAKTIVEHNKGHFSDDVGIKELPSVLAALLEIVGEK